MNFKHSTMNCIEWLCIAMSYWESLQHFTQNAHDIPACIWLKYCWCSVKQQSINQSNIFSKFFLDQLTYLILCKKNKTKQPPNPPTPNNNNTCSILGRKKIGGYSHTVDTVHLHSLKDQQVKHSTYEINDMVVKDANYRW